MSQEKNFCLKTTHSSVVYVASFAASCSAEKSLPHTAGWKAAKAASEQDLLQYRTLQQELVIVSATPQQFSQRALSPITPANVLSKTTVSPALISLAFRGVSYVQGYNVVRVWLTRSDTENINTLLRRSSLSWSVANFTPRNVAI
jgi:hypothetical protein